ncbi:hypothetical protein GGS26DRAFT_298033 [Hypomontagnella submonticulosa]|nr:hypothetical protein GGS26DRAFT_298033 [Hypomontagnella submonticulosa]
MPPKSKSVSQTRTALGDASNRANQSTAQVAGQKSSVSDEPEKMVKDLTFEEYVNMTGLTGAARTRVLKAAKERERREAQAQASNTESTTAQGGAQEAAPKKAAVASGKSSTKKRKAEMSLEEEIAAYKQDLYDAIDFDDIQAVPMSSCTTVRNRINKLVSSGIMTKAEFCRTIGCTANHLNKFLKQKGEDGRFTGSVYNDAWVWFREREVAKLKMPDVKKRLAQEAESSSSGVGGPASKKAKATSLPDISNIYLDHEETDSVSVWDTCDVVRKKIETHLRTSGVTQAQFCRDLYAQLKAPTIKCFQSKQLSDFRAGKGAKMGAKSTIFYAAYVYFEKLRIAQGKPKTEFREEMEDIWLWNGGFDRETDHNTLFVGRAGGDMRTDQYGRTSTYF